jgi:uncharacterized protein YcnI
MNTRLRALGVTALALAAGLALALAAPLGASAHVTLDENTADAGSYALLTFKVPNESETATTTSVTLTLPTETPFTSVRTVPVPGWTAELIRTELPEPVQIGETEITEAVTSVVWTATGDGIRDGELGLFPVSLGPVPDVGSVQLPVDQGYSDGSIVAWAGEDAPTLYVGDTPPADHHGGSHDDEAPGDDGDEPGAASGDTDLVGRILGGAGLVLGAVALVVALLRRRPDPRVG